MLHPGKFNDISASTMAGAIEAAFKNQWPLFNPDLPLPDEEQIAPMQLLFVAVAQGVVQHLRDNPDAFQPAVTSTTHSHSGGAHVHGDGSHTHSDGSHTHPAAIAQITAEQTTA
jgi:hypothetical protein